MIAFGPIPSRRLGRSLGINNIPPKVCSYSCIYCQLGTTKKTSIERKKYYNRIEIFNNVEEKVKKAKEKGEHIDYLSFVPDGEPTLDINLGKEIDMLRSLEIKIAVFTNGSLLSDKTVRNDLNKADLVSVKIDACNRDVWKKMNMPHKAIGFYSLSEGLSLFKSEFKGKIVTETMLLKDVNDNIEHIKKLAEYITLLKPDIAYLMVPTRPPAVKTVKAPDRSVIKKCFDIFSKNIDYTECLTEYEGNQFGYTGDIEQDILSITSVHPMREDAVEELLKKADMGWQVIDKLINEEKLFKIEYSNNIYYVRNLDFKFN